MIERVKKFFEENEDAFIEAIEDLDGQNGYLGDNRYYSMNELDDLYAGEDPTFILCRAFFGYDEDTWTTDKSGEKEYGAFNPMRNYFRFNGYGNLVSSDHKDYSSFLDDYFVESWIEEVNNGHVRMIEELRDEDE